MTTNKPPEVKAAEEADRAQLVEALAEHPGTPWGEAIEKVATLRLEHAAWGAIIDGLRASLGAVTRERDEARQYIPAAQSCHRLADYMSTNRDLLEYDGCDMAGDGAIGVLGRLARERDELRAELLNERGEGEPPSEGWAWSQGRGGWVCESWLVYRDGLEWVAEFGGESMFDRPTARECMRHAEADAALAGGKS